MEMENVRFVLDFNWYGNMASWYCNMGTCVLWARVIKAH